MKLDNFFDDRLNYIQKREIAEVMDLDIHELIKRKEVIIGEDDLQCKDLDSILFDVDYFVWLRFYFKRFEN